MRRIATVVLAVAAGTSASGGSPHAASARSVYDRDIGCAPQTDIDDFTIELL